MNNPYSEMSSEEFIRTLVSALERQMEISTTHIQLMVSRDFAKRLILELNKKHDECT